LILKNDPRATDPPHNFAGLFHFAILVPDRKSLGIAYSTLKENELQFDGFADHLVSESLYLHDPEHNGIEIYRDRPQSEWTYDSRGHVIMDTLPLDLGGILAQLPKEDRNTQKNSSEAFPRGARIGHMHLRVTDLKRSAKFYHEKLGLDISADWSSMGAMFLSAGGYHHHIGLNTWHSLGGKPHEASEAGLDSFTIELPLEGDSFSIAQLESRLSDEHLLGMNKDELSISDPDGISIRIIQSKRASS
jgi:catechol 2,3-dioxygenase